MANHSIYIYKFKPHPGSDLHAQCSPLNLTDALLHNEGDPISAAARDLGKVSAKELQTALELLMATLDGHGLQASFMAGQVTLRVAQGGGVTRR